MTEEKFDELRPSAFAIAYRMLGSVSEAEDMVQEGSSASTERARAASRWKPAAGPSLSLSMRSKW
jgi:DNA-directed RNA polymerase specialized sigma24 family protein